MLTLVNKVSKLFNILKVFKLKENAEITFECNVNDIEIFMSPSILSCCFEIEDDVRSLFINEFKDIDIDSCISIGDIIEGRQKYYLDITKVNKLVLMNLGIKEEHIYENDLCSKF